MAETKPDDSQHSEPSESAKPDEAAEKPAAKPSEHAEKPGPRAEPAADASTAATASGKSTDAASASQDTDAASDDPEALKAEIERLKAQNEALTAEKPAGHFWRNFFAVVCIVLGVISVTLAVSAVWLNRTIMDEDRFVTTMAPLAQNASIQQYAATAASNAIFDNVDIEAYVRQALAPLPPQAQILATPITLAVQNVVRTAATKITQSQQFYQLWVQILHATHKVFIAAITNRQGAIIQKQGGTVTLDVSALVDQVKQTLVDQGLKFVANINIPLQNQQIVLLNSSLIDQLGQAIQLMNTLAYVLPFLALGLLAAGIGLAVKRQKAVLWVGVGIVIATILPIQAIYLGQAPFARSVYNLAQMPTAAAQATYQIVFRYLIEANRLIAAVGLIIWIGALIAGPSKWATSLRGGFQHGLSNIGPDWDFGPAGEWIYEHASGVRTTGFILAVVLLFAIPGKTVWTLVWIAVAVIVWVALVAFFGRPRPEKKAPDSATDDDSAVSAT